MSPRKTKKSSRNNIFASFLFYQTTYGVQYLKQIKNCVIANTNNYYRPNDECNSVTFESTYILGTLITDTTHIQYLYIYYVKQSLLWNSFAIVDDTAEVSGVPLCGRGERLLDETCWGGEVILCKLSMELVLPVFGIENCNGRRLVLPAAHHGTSYRRMIIISITKFSWNAVYGLFNFIISK